MAEPPARAHGKWVDQGNGTWVRYGLRNNEIDTSLRFETWHEPKTEEKKGPGFFGLAASMAQARDSGSDSDDKTDDKQRGIVKPPLRSNKLKGIFTSTTTDIPDVKQAEIIEKKTFSTQRRGT